MENIACNNCGHSWMLEAKDRHPYLCHKCGYDNKMKKFDKKSLEDWKKNEKPYVEESNGSVVRRTFFGNVNEGELTWHRDLEDRVVIVLNETDWKLQFDNELPIALKEGQEIFIPKNTFHRVIKGNDKLMVEIVKTEFEKEDFVIFEGKKKKKKRDACYYKVKSRYDVWPSAYGSGALVKCRKVGAANWGNKTNESSTEDTITTQNEPSSDKKITFSHEHLDYYHGQHNYELGIYENGEIMGYVNYSVFENKIYINDILVRPDRRREKFGSMLVKKMKELNKDAKYEPSFKTDLGAKFVHKDVDIVEEKWSEKYKKSIDCKNPKGFSQKAHCAARKKRQAGGETKSEPINEEYFGGDRLIGYHITNKDAVESIAKNGFKVGHRKMQGRGFYAFYDREDAERYAFKDAAQVSSAMVSFKVNNPKHGILYLNMDIAKEILGDKYHLKDQIEEYFKYEGGLDYLLKQVKSAHNPDYTKQDLINKLKDIEVNNSRDKQRTFLFSMIPLDLNDKLNIVWDGEYGLEFRINYTHELKPIKYEEILFDGGRFSFKEIESENTQLNTILKQIPKTEENEALIYDIMRTDGTEMDIRSLISKYKKALDGVYSNSEFYKITREIELLNKALSAITKLNEAKKTDFSKEKEKGLHGWFSRRGGDGSRGWVDCNTCRKDPETGRKKCKPCGRKEGESRAYPACRPTPSACGTPKKGKKWGKASGAQKKKKTNEGLNLEEKNSTFVKKYIMDMLTETFRQDSTEPTTTPVETPTKPIETPETKPSRKDIFRPIRETKPDPKAQEK